MSAAWNRAGADARLSLALGLLDLSATAESRGKLLDLCELLARWAGRINLTAHRTADEVLDRLVLDALALATVLPSWKSLADLGTGAGFPGLPLAILFPNRRLTLVESRERKHHFQREAVRRLALSNVEPRLGRSDDLEPSPHDLVVAQAMAPPAEAVPQLLAWASPGGWLVIPGGERPPRIVAVTGVEASGIRRYVVPILNLPRTVWIGTCVATGT